MTELHPEPSRIAALEHDERGYPVPYIILHDKDGKPYFAANDILKVGKAIREDLCHICGQPLEEAIWFTGGPGSALLNGNVGVYHDGPLHHECMRYAMRVCPYLAQRMNRPIAEGVATRLKEKGIETQNITTIPGVPPLFISIQTPSFRIEWLGSPLAPTPAFLVPKPFRKVEYWQHGELLPLHKGAKVVKREARLLQKSLGRKGV